MLNVWTSQIAKQLPNHIKSGILLYGLLFQWQSTVMILVWVGSIFMLDGFIGENVEMHWNEKQQNRCIYIDLYMPLKWMLTVTMTTEDSK